MVDPAVASILDKALSGAELDVAQGERLFIAAGEDLRAIIAAADDLRHSSSRFSGAAVLSSSPLGSRANKPAAPETTFRHKSRTG